MPLLRIRYSSRAYSRADSVSGVPARTALRDYLEKQFQ